MCRFCEDDQVKVKLADLGTSSFVGPQGFNRRPGTPAHTAPEAMQCAGKESLSEKVIILLYIVTIISVFVTCLISIIMVTNVCKYSYMNI